MLKIHLCLLLLLFTGTALAQECGPSCPVCSGAGANDGALLSKGTAVVSALAIPDADEERTVLNLKYGVLSWLDAGIGWAVRTEKVLWAVRTQPILEQEDGWRPGVILGSGSVQTGGSDQSVYLQLIKSLKLSGNFDLRLATGVATLVPDFEEVYGQAGATASILKQYSAFANYDGESFHEGISWTPSEWLSLSLLLVETEYPAVSVVFRR